MKLFVCSFFVFACAITDIQGAAGPGILAATSQNAQPALTPEDLARQREHAVLHDIDYTVDVIVDSLEALFNNNASTTFFSHVLKELFSMTHYTDSLDSLYLMNEAMTAVGDMVTDRETSDILGKAMLHLDTIFTDPTKHAQVKSLIDTTHKLVMDPRVKEIKEGALGFLEEIMRDPTKKIAIGELMLRALEIGQKAKSINMLADSVSALDGILMSPQMRATIINQLKATAAIPPALRMGITG